MNDTITAIATPEGRGGISVIRISGPEAFRVAGRLFVPSDRKQSSIRPWRVRSGVFRDPDTGVTLDEVLTTCFRHPHSYTGEDVVEVSCHGSPLITRSILELIIRHGVRPAEPGEFTRRAFESGRIDLSQAEAVAMMTASESETSRHAAMSMLQGGLREPLRRIRKAITGLRTAFELDLDFPEEGQSVPVEQVESSFRDAEQILKNLIDAGDAGENLRQCRQIVISGKVNAGKSSLFNQLTGRDRAIVSSEEGTTRDILEISATWQGCRLTLVDTAGIRSSRSVAETEAVRRSMEALVAADMVIHVIDGANPDPELLWSSIEVIRNGVILVFWNKTDICPPDPALIARILAEKRITGLLQGSAKAGQGIGELRLLIGNVLNRQTADHSGEAFLMMTVRQRNTLDSTLSLVIEARQRYGESVGLECIVPLLRSIDTNLGLILGDTIPPDILEEIFSGFCIGK